MMTPPRKKAAALCSQVGLDNPEVGSQYRVRLDFRFESPSLWSLDAADLFVDWLPGACVEAAAAIGQAAGGQDGGQVSGVAGQQPRPAMRWTNVMSAFVFRHFYQLISTGVRTDKGFKEVHLNQVVKVVHEFSSNEVTGTQVYNHLRKWRQRWIKVVKLREFSGALWDEDNFMITLENEHYNGHIKAYPKDADLLNKPIENYQQMQIIFGNGLATGKFAMGSSEPLGSPSDFADSESEAMK
nr:uncharacterized protein LOC117856159 [Setaria viridis]